MQACQQQHISIIITFCSEIIAQVDLRLCILNLRGVSLDIDRGGAEFPRKRGMGGAHILGYLEWGCQISWDAKYPVTPVRRCHGAVCDTSV